MEEDPKGNTQTRTSVFSTSKLSCPTATFPFLTSTLLYGRRLFLTPVHAQPPQPSSVHGSHASPHAASETRAAIAQHPRHSLPPRSCILSSDVDTKTRHSPAT
ncbi:uncharacterized protein MYCGRDRAFT_111735, partial [Zymoseptoria tritici IPO323]